MATVLQHDKARETPNACAAGTIESSESIFNYNCLQQIVIAPTESYSICPCLLSVTCVSPFHCELAAAQLYDTE